VSERIDTLARALVTRREARDKAKNEHDRAKDAFEETQQAIWEHMEEHGMTTMTLDLGTGFGKVQFQKRETVRGIVKDPEKAVASIKDLGLDDALLGPQKIQQRALSENMRDWIASGQPIPEGLDFNPTRYVSISRK
jgi:hypothetical protein